MSFYTIKGLLRCFTEKVGGKLGEGVIETMLSPELWMVLFG
ncbi:MAG: hypothetical protein ACPGVB_07865 [Chitinophagales bacterium]